MKQSIFLCVLLLTVTAFAQINGPEYWSEGRIEGYEEMIDGDERTCGRFLECGAALYIHYEFDYWYDPSDSTVDKHIWWVKPGPYEWGHIYMPHAVDTFINENGYLLLLVEGCICGQGNLFFSWWDGDSWKLLLQAADTNEFCMSEFEFTHRPGERVKFKHPPISMEGEK